jgi:CIC family chloride channel protein
MRGALSKVLGRIRRGEHVFAVASALLIGIMAGYGAIGFRLLIRLFQGVFFGAPEYTLGLLSGIPWWQRLVFPGLGGLGVGLLVTRVAPEVKGSGVPEVMDAVARFGGSIRFRVLWVKALAAGLTIGSGGSAGREGPIVHIGSAMASFLGRAMEVSAQRLRTFVACGAAGAIAATFNAPIAGALFSVEVVLGDVAVARLAPIVIASVVATVISRYHLGDFPAFQVPAYELVSARELFLYGVLGLAAGLAAVAFIRLLERSSDAFESSPIPPWLRPAAGGLLVGVIAQAFPQVFGVGYETIGEALWGTTSALVVLLVLAKMVATALTLGSGGSGGIFAPSLLMGASLGAAWGSLVHGLFPEWTATAGAYALVGMGAMLTATTHAPIAGILIIFELTNDYRIIPPLMVACVLGLLLSSLLHRDSIYTSKLSRRGVRLREGRDVNLLRSIPVHEVMDREAPTVPAGMPFTQLVPRLVAGSHKEVMVVGEDGELMGMVSLSDVGALLPETETLGDLVVAADAVQEDVPFVLPSDNLDLAMHLFGRTQRDELPVCADPASRRVVGVITRDALIDSYNRRIFQVDLPGGFGSLVDAVEGGRTVEVLGGVHLAEVEVPYGLVGRTLRQADVRRRWGVEVVLIRTVESGPESLEGRPGRLPAADVRLRAGDRLLVMGTQAAIRRLREGV